MNSDWAITVAERKKRKTPKYEGVVSVYHLCVCVVRK